MEEYNGQKVKLHERVATLEANMHDLLTNHIPHLQESLNTLQFKVDRMTWFLVVTLVGVVVDLISRFIK